MRRVVQTLAALAIAGVIGAVTVVGLGLYNVSALTGHWPGVGWVLHTTFRNSVALRAVDEDAVPDLVDPSMIELGARHYASACAGCHALPGQARTATMRAMVPAPPHIAEAVRHWEPNELHWIVLNGIKMSGMPAWPAAGREEEVWPVVAYLMQVKAGLSSEAQAGLTATAPIEGPPGMAYCAGCHSGVGGAIPRLDIQTPDYLKAALAGYLDGSRPSGIMAHAVSTVPRDVLPDLARALGDIETETARAVSPSPEGETLAKRGTDDVPACTACHGPGLARMKPGTPALAGQAAPFLSDQLRLWRDGGRSGSDVMTKAAADLTDQEIDALARYYATLEPIEPE